MILQLDRYERQVRLRDVFISTGARGYIEAATGFGKSYVLILIIKECLRRDPNRKVHVVVPSTNLKDDWTAPIVGHIVVHQLWNVEVFVINSYLKQERECDLLCGDEAHRYTGVKAIWFSTLLTRTKYKFVILCSATLDPQKKTFLSALGINLVGSVPLKECLQKGWVSDFIVYNWGISLPEEEKIKYDNLTKTYNALFAVFNWDMDLALSCMGTECARAYANTLTNEWDYQRVITCARIWQKAMKDRNEMIYNAGVKLNACLNVINKFKTVTLTFSKSTAFADTLTEKLSPNAISYHSKQGKKQRREILNNFSDLEAEYKVLNTVNAVNEGLNIPEADLGIVTSTTQVNLTAIQRIGRMIRAKEGKLARIIWLYILDSVEVKRVVKSQVNVPNRVWVESLDEII